MQKKLTVLFAFAIFVLVVGWAITPVQAHCKDKGPHLEHCNGDDGRETPTIVETDVQWGGDITESKTRPCVAAQVLTNGDYGEYLCQLDPPGSNEIRYNLGVGVQTARKGDASLCNVFNPINLTPDRFYEYNWSDNCGDGTCTIEINNWFSEEETGAGFIRLRAFAEATGPFMDANPFVDSLMLDVDEINIIFYAAGSNKKIAECQYLFDPSESEVTFQTDQK